MKNHWPPSCEQVKYPAEYYVTSLVPRSRLLQTSMAYPVETSATACYAKTLSHFEAAIIRSNTPYLLTLIMVRPSTRTEYHIGRYMLCMYAQVRTHSLAPSLAPPQSTVRFHSLAIT